MPSNSSKPPRVRAEAVRLAATGMPPRSVAEQIRKRFKTSCSTSSVRKWVNQAQDAAPVLPPPVEPVPPLIVDAPDTDAPTDLLEDTIAQYREMRRMSKRASEDGNHVAAQRFSKQAVDLKLLIARLQPGKDGDSVSIPRADLELARQTIRGRIAALAADTQRTGGLVCAECGRGIRIRLAKGE